MNTESFTVDRVIPLRDLVRRYLAWCVAMHGGDRSAAARAIGTTERTIRAHLGPKKGNAKK